ncbi:hypothetical protein TNCV_970801 [Trichonephila clavipes]|nr:hypothetical protein TNCV_970801 [Trichonephila clavipes]
MVPITEIHSSLARSINQTSIMNRKVRSDNNKWREGSLPCVVIKGFSPKTFTLAHYTYATGWTVHWKDLPTPVLSGVLMDSPFTHRKCEVTDQKGTEEQECPTRGPHVALQYVLDESRSFFRVHTGYFSNIPKCIKAEFIASWGCSQSSVVSSSKR